MERVSKIYGIDTPEGFARFLIDRAKEEKLLVTVTFSSESCSVTIEPYEHRLYFCPYHGKVVNKEG